MGNNLFRELETENGYGCCEVVQRPKRLRLYSAGHISAVERAGLHGLDEGQKVSFEAKADPRRGKTSAENLKAL